MAVALAAGGAWAGSGLAALPPPPAVEPPPAVAPADLPPTPKPRQAAQQSPRSPTASKRGRVAPAAQAEAIPPPLFAMAALAILLLALASAPVPARSSRTGAMLVHMRGSIAVAGMTALTMALGTYFLL